MERYARQLNLQQISFCVLSVKGFDVRVCVCMCEHQNQATKWKWGLHVKFYILHAAGGLAQRDSGAMMENQ
jgi:hypothetical protein